MPLFEFSCDNCSYTFDKMVMRFDSKVNCPICQGNVKKLMSTFTVDHSQDAPVEGHGAIPPKMCTNC